VIDASLNELTRYFADRPNRAGVMARSWLGRRSRDDDRHRDHLITAAAASIGTDGSVRGSLLATAVTLIELDRLEAPAPVRDPLIRWLLGRQFRPGAFSDGCTAARHQHRVCEHFLSGFFSPASPAQRAAPITLPNGKEFRVESQVRFVSSCLALDALARSGRTHEPGMERHLDSFEALLDEWSAWGQFLPPDLACSALSALASADHRWRQIIDPLVGIFGQHQQSDGTWRDTDFFHALDALGRVRSDAVLPLLERAAPTLLRRQRDDGSFGSVAADERALIGLRVLLRVNGRPAGRPAGTGS
jgi:hypothetical protein